VRRTAAGVPFSATQPGSPDRRRTTVGGGADANADTEGAALAEAEPLDEALAEAEPLTLGRAPSKTP
jgi:hypothetical protein